MCVCVCVHTHALRHALALCNSDFQNFGYHGSARLNKSVGHETANLKVMGRSLTLGGTHLWGVGGTMVKDPPASAGDLGDLGSIPGSERFPWRWDWLLTPVFLLGKSCRQRSLAGYCPWGCKESDTTERLNTHTCTWTGYSPPPTKFTH